MLSVKILLIMLSVIILGVIMLSVIMLDVIMLRVVAPFLPQVPELKESISLHVYG
jgi:hypothetical protein